MVFTENSEGKNSPRLGEAEAFYRLYELEEELGRGLSSIVRCCRKLDTNQEYAVKIIEKWVETEDCFINSEIQILRYLSNFKHENIIHLEATFETSSHFFLVFELATGGELFQLLTRKVYFPEPQAKLLMTQILKAIAFMHDHNIVHRDMKLENILLTHEGSVKISDFGFATFLKPSDTLSELLGTPGYFSPELITCNLYGNNSNQKGYGKPVDMWAAGVIMYTLLVGFPPFWNNNRITLMKQIMCGKFEFVSPYWDNISQDAKDLLTRLLCVAPDQRMTAHQALNHPWIVISTPLLKPFFFAKQKFKAVVFCLIAIRALQRGLFSRVSQKEQDAFQVIQVAEISDIYLNQHIRKALDECAFKTYGHWVKKQNHQNRAALFENFPKAHWENVKVSH